MKPLEVWLAQGTGVGLPLIMPLHENPVTDKALMDQLVDTGSRTIMGVAAVNGLALRKMRVGRDIKDLLSGFEEAAAHTEPATKAVREMDITPHNEMESGKLPEIFSIFKLRVGSKDITDSGTSGEEEESEEEEPKEKDDEVDFDVSDEDVEFEEEEDDDEVQPEEPPEPEWPDIEVGPLTGEGAFSGDPYIGYRMVYPNVEGRFTTVTRVVAATHDGLPKVIISYAVNAMEKEKGQVPEPWKEEEVRSLMRLSRLRVGMKAAQLLMFGWNSTKDSLPTAPDENLFFPQYVPTRAKCPTPSFTVTWVRKVTTIRAVQSRIRADPPPLTTGLLGYARTGLKGVVVTDLNCPRSELRCLVPWRPWAKKNKVQWEHQRPSGNCGWNREFLI